VGSRPGDVRVDDRHIKMPTEE
jgi:hypothetical protein